MFFNCNVIVALSCYVFHEVDQVLTKLTSQNLQKRKEKNISKCSLTVMAPSPFQITFSKRSSCPERNFQAEIYKKEKKNVSKHSLTVIVPSSLQITFSKSSGRNFS